MESSRPKESIRPVEGRIAEMERGDIRHYREDCEGRLCVDDTPRMLRAARALLRLRKRIALLAVSGKMPRGHA